MALKTFVGLLILLPLTLALRKDLETAFVTSAFEAASLTALEKMVAEGEENRQDSNLSLGEKIELCRQNNQNGFGQIVCYASAICPLIPDDIISPGPVQRLECYMLTDFFGRMFQFYIHSSGNGALQEN